jgi:hypothetical protein
MTCRSHGHPQGTVRDRLQLRAVSRPKGPKESSPGPASLSECRPEARERHVLNQECALKERRKTPRRRLSPHDSKAPSPAPQRGAALGIRRWMATPGHRSPSLAQPWAGLLCAVGAPIHHLTLTASPETPPR